MTDLSFFYLPALLAVVCVVSYGGAWWVSRIALRRGLLDIPNQRSSHSIPTPRGGGLALLLGLYLGGGCLALMHRMDIPGLFGLSVCGLGIAAAGLWDDVFQLSALKRIIVHFGCVFLAVNFFIPDDAFLRPGDSLIVSLAIRLLVVVGIVWLLNLFNFMDGIDGLAGSEVMSVSLGCTVLLLSKGAADSFVPLLLVLSASALGFLLWNWPPAKIFMGDACSGFLGFFLGITALLTLLSTPLTVWTWALLLAAFVVDATVTLAVRILRGEKFYHPHRSHAYQILSRRVGSHLKVTLYYMGVNTLFLFPLAWLSVYKPDYGMLLVLLSYSLLTVFCLVIGAGTTSD